MRYRKGFHRVPHQVFFLFLQKIQALAQRYFIELAYNGTRFHGWQVQPNAPSVQEHLEKALSVICRERISVTGAGRTDTGVHARFFVAHFDSENERLDHPEFIGKLNGFLNNDIIIFRIYKVKPDAHARFDAISRTYHYYITRQKDPFAQETAWYFKYPLDVGEMNEACRILFEYSDFTSFSKLHSDVKTNNCKIYQAEWKEQGSQLIFVVKADRFLRNMVRAIVGTLIEVGQGKISPDDFRQVIELKNRGAAGVSVPARGLFIVGIEYPENLM